MTDKQPPSREEFEEQQAKLDALEQQLVEQKKELIQQDHRPLAVIMNLVKSYTREDAIDNREASSYAAASLAFSWFMRRSRIILGAGLIGGTVALGTLLVSAYQTHEVRKQNVLFTKQNKLFQQQMVDQQRSTNAQILATLLAEIETAEKDTVTTVKDSLGFWKPSQSLVHRIHSAARAFAPYGNDSLSYERGQLVEAVANAKIRFPLDPNPDFKFANLSGANLSGANLSGANLRGANISQANLRGANLGGANLRGADLNWAVLTGANLLYAYLRGADLIGARLSGARLILANLKGTNLNHADLIGANLLLADLSGANLNEAKLTSSQLISVRLHKAQIDSALLDTLINSKPQLFDSIPGS